MKFGAALAKAKGKIHIITQGRIELMSLDITPTGCRTAELSSQMHSYGSDETSLKTQTEE